MNQQIKQQWTQALRSGEYQQVKYALHNDQGYCVLGVLCDLHRQTMGLAWEAEVLTGYPYLGVACSLPYAVQRWAELHDRSLNTLTNCNDKGVEFTLLANWIDENL